MAKLPPRGRHSRILGFGASSSKRRVLQSSLFYNRKNRLSRLSPEEAVVPITVYTPTGTIIALPVEPTRPDL